MHGWRSLVLPREHGAWGLLAGAALIGLPLGDDLTGAALLIAALAGVVLRQACSVRGWTTARILVLALAAGAAAGSPLLVAMSAGARSWLPWFLAAALAGGIAFIPIPGRPWWASAIAGAGAALLAAAIAIAGGAQTAWAATAALVLGLHLVAAVPLVRSQTRADPAWPRLAIDLHIVAVLIAVGGWAAGLLPSGIPLIPAICLVRALLLVDKQTPMSSSPARIGMRELAWLPVLAAGVVLALRSGPC